MRSTIRLLAGLLLALSFSASAQQAQTTAPTTTPPPVVHHRATHPAKAPAPQAAPAAKPVPLSNDNHYTNSSGNVVHLPAKAPSVPPGASAVCGDGSYSFSQHARGTCSHHGGVARWL
ncbi:MAG: DUF3761 domain-containing protein [Acidobacteriaceae bacterium]